MDAEKARSLALAEMRRWGLIDKGWKFAFNTRRRSLGLCSPKKRTIFLSRYFLDKVSDFETRDTVLHEIAHALEVIRHGTSGHGPVWKSICREVGAQPIAKCNAKIHHQYPYVIKYEDRIVKGLWKLPKDIHERLQGMSLRGRPETLGKLKLYRVNYKREA